VLRRGYCVPAGCIHDHDTLFTRRIDSNIVETYPCPADNLETSGLIDYVFRDLGGAPYCQAVIIFYYAFKLVRSKVGYYVDLNSRGVFKYLYTFFCQIIAYQ